jgi:hypothetical protein
MDICQADMPYRFPVSADHWSRCWLISDHVNGLSNGDQTSLQEHADV